ncbi:hypothetical protein B0H10DRAFT_1956609 [Mycena sp. CBHHK59/15]|nr:hypothetical protein B0H10DRAFT_1956609 [Mycena sp. CBHHK59/15]
MRQTQAALCGRVQFPKRYQRVARRTGHVRYRARRAGTHGAGRGQHECEKGRRRVQLSAWWKIARASRDGASLCSLTLGSWGIPPVPPNIRNHQGRKASGGGVYTIQPPDCGQRYAVYAHGGPGWDDLLLEWLWTVITREARWNAN